MGVALVEGGVNVAVAAPDATAVWFCLFEATETRHRLTGRTGDVHHGFIPGIGAGACYGLRAAGPWNPEAGHRFNPAKLLVDPYATALDRPFALAPELFDTGDSPDTIDSAGAVPKAIVTAPLPPLPPRPAPAGPRVIYELHVRGFTMRHPGVPAALRGTFAGLAHPAAIAHLTRLGVTAVELLPAAAWIDERHLPPLGLTNYWGYNPVTFLASDPRLAPGGMAEVRAAVAALQAAGISVIQDVVFNHTGEGDRLGPTLSLRGLGNAAYHRLDPAHPGGYVNDAGCGNTLALDRPWPLRLVMDALRHWSTQAGMDGFRLDLATTLGRFADGAFHPHAALLAAMRQDPVLREKLIIAEPWDIGPGGYQLGRFPPGWGEWNDRFRDDVRKFWRGDAGTLGALATRLAGSSDAFSTRPATDSINYVTAHDGFTLADLVSYAHRHNGANGEQGRDGAGENHSWNHGHEGATGDPAITARRKADARALLATLLCARGTPMLSMGDEAGRTQHGNNNAYCQDNLSTWIDWAAIDDALADFTARLVALRLAHPALHNAAPLTGAADASGQPDMAWLRPDGGAMQDHDWAASRGVVAVLHAEGDRVLVALNGADASTTLYPPPPRWGFAWHILADSFLPAREGAAGAALELHARSVALLGEAPATKRRAHAPDAALLDRLAHAAGIETRWHDISCQRHDVPETTVRSLLAALDLPAETAAQARDSLGRVAAPMPAPEAGACFLPPCLVAGARGFGIAAQTYALRHGADQGIGDFTALAALARRAGEAGALVVGISPPHALMPTDRERASPYQPSDRRFLEPALLDVTALPFSGALAAEAPAFARLRQGGLVDYPAVWAAKRRVLYAAWQAFGPAHPAWESFAAFRAAGGAALEGFARFTAIAEAEGHTDIARWPEGLRAGDSTDVGKFAERNDNAVGFHAFLQWLCDAQLAAAGRAGAGLYRDLAVGSAPDGAEVWAQPGLYLRGFSVGAPPDPLGPLGQVWGLPPVNPLAPGLVPAFGALLDANMRHAAALRIDHVMALARLFVVPEGAPGAEGCYLRYPLASLLAEVTRASRQARCLVVGEDLGTVPDGLRPRLEAARVLSYRVLWFERDHDTLRPPAHWPALATACVSTHDLPTLAGWWDGADIAERAALGLLDSAGAEAAGAERAQDRATLLRAMADGDNFDAYATFISELAGAIHAHVAATPSLLALVQAEDLAGETVGVNLPGTDRERPNWRRRLGVDVATLLDGGMARKILAAMTSRRRT
jgi:glycogen operon protein